MESMWSTKYGSMTAVYNKMEVKSCMVICNSRKVVNFPSPRNWSTFSKIILQGWNRTHNQNKLIIQLPLMFPQHHNHHEDRLWEVSCKDTLILAQSQSVSCHLTSMILTKRSPMSVHQTTWSQQQARGQTWALIWMFSVSSSELLTQL